VRVVWVVPAVFLSGGIRIVTEYANRLQRLGHENVIVSLLPLPDQPPFHVEARLAGADELERLAAGADALVATDYRAAEAVVRCRVARRRFHFVQNREALFARRAWEQRRIERQFAYPLIPIAISHWLAGVLRLHGKEAFVIHNGLDTTVFREYDHLRPAHNRVLVEGQSVPWKRVDLGIEAARLAGADEVWALTIGQAPAGADKTLTGLDSRGVAEVYSSCTAMVKLSDFEGYPAPQAEAMACGCPVVTTSAPGTIEYCVDGENSLVVPLRDAEAAAEALSRLADADLSKRLVEGGRRTVREGFGWEDKVRSMEATLSGSAAPSDLACPLHSREQSERLAALSRPYSLPYRELVTSLGKHAPYGLGGLRDRAYRRVFRLPVGDGL